MVLICDHATSRNRSLVVDPMAFWCLQLLLDLRSDNRRDIYGHSCCSTFSSIHDVTVLRAR